MRFDQPLDDALRTGSHVRVLRVLALKPPAGNMSARAVARRAAVSHPRVAEVLADLARQGIVASREGLGYGIHELNEEHTAVRALRRIFEWEQGVSDDLVTYLRRAIAARAQHVRAALLFGELAWGDPGSSGTVQVAVLTAPDKEAEVWEALTALEERVRRRFGNRLDLLVASRRRAAEEARKGRRPWRRIAEGGVPLYRTFPR
jgi:DNA-binding transcriptional regulator YhcF (GntR family)